VIGHRLLRLLSQQPSRLNMSLLAAAEEAVRGMDQAVAENEATQENLRNVAERIARKAGERNE
jgi:hypothetical protein